MVRIAVTGASGFIGHHLVAHLSEQGHDVVAVKRLGKRPAGAAGHGESNAYGPESFFQRDAIIHLAGRAHVLHDAHAAPREAFWEANVALTDNLLDVAIEAGVRRLVFVSTIGVNGPRTYGKPFTSVDEPKPEGTYAESKWAAELLVRERSQLADLDTVIVRPSLVYGPDAPGNFGSLLRLVGSGMPMPVKSLRAERNLVSVWSLVDLLERCVVLPRAANKIFLAAESDRLTPHLIVCALARGMNVRCRSFSIPSWALGLLVAATGKRQAIGKLSDELLIDASLTSDELQWRADGVTLLHLVRTGAEFARATPR